MCMKGILTYLAAKYMENVFLGLSLSQTVTKADYSWLVHDYNEKLPAMLKYIIHSVKNC